MLQPTDRMSVFNAGLLRGRSAFVAGGTSGINLAIAARLAALGAKVAVAGRDADRAERAAAIIGHGGLGLTCDVRDFATTRNALEAAAMAFGSLDIVISGAAGNFVAPALSMSANAFRTVVDIDLNGTFNVFRACYELLRRPGASLIAITAGQAVHPIMQQAHACAAKAGINQLIRVLAMEWGPSGVRVNGISPGPIAGTEGMARLAPTEEAVTARTARIPLRRFGSADEVADSAVFLCSNAAAYITGTILDCDGGSQLGDASDRDIRQGLG
ncbi:MAG: Short-chain dehydrogenase [Bradyrhizobium sp.]|jgi:NAD(P)-dependent dehydrogenase (short-subunit alcohol dehydrogenase family)|nr:Short-chain dehydrogenase [Bradyrhizobium sp.]